MTTKTEEDKLIQQILVLPDKISHEILVPLSSVAFTSGKLIHTNEFLVPDNNKQDNEIGGVWMSHKEAASWIRRNKPMIGTKTLHEVNKEHDEYDESDSDDSDSDFNDDDKTPNVMEIREFVDERGKILRQDVVDVVKQIGDMSNVVEEQLKQQEIKNNSEEIKKRKDLLQQLQSEMNHVTGHEVELDEHAKFVRELATVKRKKKKNTTNKSDKSGGDGNTKSIKEDQVEDGLLSSLCHLNFNMVKSGDANSVSVRDLGSSSSSSSSSRKNEDKKKVENHAFSGFSKGFLGTSKKKHITRKLIKEKSVSFDSTESPTVTNDVKKAERKNPAFTGMIMERRPPS